MLIGGMKWIELLLEMAKNNKKISNIEDFDYK